MARSASSSDPTQGAEPLPLASCVALVTGATRGIGKGCALELGAAGATVYATGRSTDARPGLLPGTVEQTSREIDVLGGRGVAVELDQRDDQAVAELIDRVLATHGRIDVLVNSAFAVDPSVNEGLPFWGTPLSSWDDQMTIGTRSAYVATRAVALPMIDARSGLVVNISSFAAARYAWQVAYGVAKCALDRLTADTARELSPYGVSVVSLWPGFALTERNQQALALLPAEDQVDASQLESARFTGRAVAALAGDPDRTARSGEAFWTRQLAHDYGFTDVSGDLPAKVVFPRRNAGSS